MLSYLFLDLLGCIVSCIKQGLACFIGGSETVLMGINLPLKTQEEGRIFSEIPFLLLTRNKHCIQYFKKGRYRLYFMLLVAVKQSLRSGDIIGQFVGIDESFHLSHPAGQIPEVSSETLQPGKDGQKTAEVRRVAL